MANLKDIAEYVGVSISTVSYVVNGKAEKKRIALDTQKKIWDAVNHFNYKPNMAAKRLQVGEHNLPTYAVMWKTDIHSNILERFIIGTQKQKKKDGDFELVVYPYSSKDFKATVQRIRLLQYNGIVFLMVSQAEIEYLEAITFDIPIVLFGRSPKYHSLFLDDYEIARISVQHMYDCGCRKIGIIMPILVQAEFGDACPIRITHFLKIAAALGIEVFYTDKKYDYSIEGGIRAIEDVYRLHPDVDGIYSYVDIMAVGVIQWQITHYKEFKRCIRVMSHGNTSYALVSHPQITSTNFPIEDMSQKAIRLLQKNAGAVNVASIHEMMPVELIIRDSCAHIDFFSI